MPQSASSKNKKRLAITLLFLALTLFVTLFVVFVINKISLNNTNKADNFTCGNGACEGSEVCEWDSSIVPNGAVRICNNGNLDHGWAMKSGDNCNTSCKVVRNINGSEVDVSNEYIHTTSSSNSSIANGDAKVTSIIESDSQPFTAQIKYYGDSSNIETTNNGSILETSVREFACSKSDVDCEPEKFEINFNKKIAQIYGLGRQTKFDKASVNLLPKSRFDNGFNGAVEEYYDDKFGIGTLTTSDEQALTKSLFSYDVDVDGDAGRMRTPMVVLPQENMIIAYIQPAVKIVRITRSVNEDRTQFVFSKKPGDPVGDTGKLVIIKGTSLVDTYTKYKNYLQNRAGFYFKNPNYETFGNHWETRSGYTMKVPTAGGATVEALRFAYDKFTNVGIKLSSLTFGSGFWPKNVSNADWGGLGHLPTIESLQAKEGHALNAFFEEILTKGTKPMIGMRMMASVNYKSEIGTTGVNRVSSVLSSMSSNITNPFLNLPTDLLYTSIKTQNAPISLNKVINLDDALVASTYVSALQNAYGPFAGIKEDEMLISYQKSWQQKLSADGEQLNVENFVDGYAQKMFPYFSQINNGDNIIIGSGNWFGVGDDAQLASGWKTYEESFYGSGSDRPSHYKLQETQIFSQVISGYPNSFDDVSSPVEYINSSGVICKNSFGEGSEMTPPVIQNYGNCKIRQSDLPKLLARIKDKAFSPFFMQSEGFWHIDDATADGKRYRDAMIFYLQLRSRLQQYAYDNALKWVDDGTSHLMRPLFFDNPEDSNAYKLYDAYNGDYSQPKNEWMFGDSLLVRPIYRDGETSVSVYLPSGKWRAFLQANPAGSRNGNQYTTYSVNTSNNLSDYPVFLKEGEILPIRNGKLDKMYVYVFLDDITTSNIYKMTEKDGHTFRMQAQKSDGNVVIKNLDTGSEMTMSLDNYGKGFMVADITSWTSYTPQINDKLIISESGKTFTQSDIASGFDETNDLVNSTDGANEEGNFSRSSVRSSNSAQVSASGDFETTSSTSTQDAVNNENTSSVTSSVVTSQSVQSSNSTNANISTSSDSHTASSVSASSESNNVSQTVQCNKYDVNSDGKLDIFYDFTIFLNNLTNNNLTSDFNHDKLVDIKDFLLFREALYSYFNSRSCN